MSTKKLINEEKKDPKIKPSISKDIIRSTGLINVFFFHNSKLNQNQINKGIYVTNISSKCTIKKISDFFSFCGTIEKLVLEKYFLKLYILVTQQLIKKIQNCLQLLFLNKKLLLQLAFY
jgi:hypothetical protein